MTEKSIKFIVKKSLISTLRVLPIGKPIRIKTRDFKMAAARSAKYRLEKEGIIINLSEAKMIDEYEVTRIK